ncbi:hypothetical protein CLV36_11279 [Laceyella sediminis]|uniref:Uncharacterized protein n=1 Tax=Laceyella sediminis TaxID=573074 RepID=A0ABX5EL68_9BACL|nr:hypothetical protein CLV36_11279 [Laceyella sediminis]
MMGEPQTRAIVCSNYAEREVELGGSIDFSFNYLFTHFAHSIYVLVELIKGGDSLIKCSTCFLNLPISSFLDEFTTKS